MDSSTVRAGVGIEGTKQSASLERTEHKEVAVNRTGNFTAPGHGCSGRALNDVVLSKWPQTQSPMDQPTTPLFGLQEKKKTQSSFPTRESIVEREGERGEFEEGRGYG